MEWVDFDVLWLDASRRRRFAFDLFFIFYYNGKLDLLCFG